MKTLILLSVFASLFNLSATIPADETPGTTLRTGRYGVCGCSADTRTQEHIALTIDPNGTFQFIDHTDAKQPVDASGAWEVNGRTLTLHSTSSDGRTEQTWTTDKEHPCLRTRQGSKSTRLCLLAACE